MILELDGWDWINDALDEMELRSIEAQEARYETEPVDG
jgi:hypothetical protein